MFRQPRRNRNRRIPPLMSINTRRVPSNTLLPPRPSYNSAPARQVVRRPNNRIRNATSGALRSGRAIRFTGEEILTALKVTTAEEAVLFNHPFGVVDDAILGENCTPMLKQYASLYDRYRVNRLTLTYTPWVPTTTGGFVVFGIDLTPSHDKQFQEDNGVYMLPCSRMSSVYCGFSVNVPSQLINTRKWFSTRRSVGDVKLPYTDTYPISIVFRYSSTLPGSIGIMTINYDIEFEGPSVHVPEGIVRNFTDTSIAAPGLDKLSIVDTYNPVPIDNVTLPVVGPGVGALILNPPSDPVHSHVINTKDDPVESYICNPRTDPVVSRVVNTKQKPFYTSVVNDVLKTDVTNDVAVKGSVTVDNGPINPVPVVSFDPVADSDYVIPSRLRSRERPIQGYSN